ncbi:RES domain-containing protein [Microbacterium sp. AGC62]
MDYPEGFSSINATLCIRHVTDDVLRERLLPDVDGFECSFCGLVKPAAETPFAVSMDLLGEYVWEAASWMYSDPGYIEYYDGEPWSTEGLVENSEVMYDIAGDALEEVVVDDVLLALTNAINDREYWSYNDHDYRFSLSWTAFQETVKTQSRFVFIGTSARPGHEDEPPARLAKFLNALLTYVESELLVDVPRGTKLYRGRMVDELDNHRVAIAAEPSTRLGPAPSEKAEAGRLNSKGISLFYAADDVDTAVGEIALHSPYDVAIMGGFVTQRHLKVLDFTRSLTTLPSIFATDEESRNRWLFSRFAERFTKHITAPVLLDGRQLVDYAPTQVVAEYLRYVPETRIDGIAWPSHVGAGNGKNVALFIGPGPEFRTDPPTETEKRRASKEPALTLSRDDVTEHRVKRRVKVKRLEKPEPWEDEAPMHMDF